MTEQLKYRARLKAKGMDTTGVTEDHARAMAAHLGGHTMLIVEVTHDSVTTDAEGNQQVTLRATGVEPVPAELEDKVREFQRALYRQRPEVLGQETLKGTADGPTPDAALGELEDAADEWSGDPDEPAPVTDNGGAAEVTIAGAKGKAGLSAVPDGVDDGGLAEECPAPGCELVAEHDGDHAQASGE